MVELFTQLSLLSELPLWLLTIVIVWSLIWKALAMWKAAKKDSPIWFVLLLVINTVGIFEILYFFLFSEMKINKHPFGGKPVQNLRGKSPLTKRKTIRRKTN